MRLLAACSLAGQAWLLVALTQVIRCCVQSDMEVLPPYTLFENVHTRHLEARQERRTERAAQSHGQRLGRSVVRHWQTAFKMHVVFACLRTLNRNIERRPKPASSPPQKGVARRRVGQFADKPRDVQAARPTVGGFEPAHQASILPGSGKLDGTVIRGVRAFHAPAEVACEQPERLNESFSCHLILLFHEVRHHSPGTRDLPVDHLSTGIQL